jgi:hypothetical protein
MDHESAAASESNRVAVPSGHAYRVDSPPWSAIVTRDLAAELQRVLELFAADADFTQFNPVRITFRPGVVGHHRVGRAADIYAVGGLGLDAWKKRSDAAHARAARSTDPALREAIVREERRGNLGWRLYRALQCYGRWAQPYGYPVQLFGPWTRSEGPWRYISDRLLDAHRDHIHLAR